MRFHAQADTFWAEAWLSSQGGEGSLTVRLRNYTLAAIPMSYVSDEYIAQLRDGSTEALEKADFYAYPIQLGTGEQAAVRLRLPKQHAIRDMTALVIRLQQGRIVLVLNPDTAPARRPDIPPAAPAVLATEPFPVPAMPPLPAAVEPSPLPVMPSTAPAPELPLLPASTAAAAQPMPAPSAPANHAPLPAEWASLPAAEVPVVVEFSQDFGGSLTLQVQWDQTGQTQTISPETRNVFRVAPGPHTCTLRSTVQGLTPTTAQVPMVVAGNEPMRLIVRGAVTLEGVTLRVEVWNNVTNDLLLERTFHPGA